MLRTHHVTDNSLDYFIEVDDQQQFMSIRCSGTLTLDSTIHMIKDVKKHQAPDVNYHRLYDFSEIQIDVGISEYEDIFTESKKAFGSIRNVYKVAFVSNDPFILQLLSIFKILSNKQSFHEIQYFRTTIQALGWLKKKDR